MNKTNLIFTLSLLILQLAGLELSATTTSATYEGNLVSKEGAWCWFADPRALHFENREGTINNTYMGYIDVHGNIKATQHNFITGKNNEVLIRSYFQADDHDNPSFLVLPDERVMIFYSRHTDEACFYYRISAKPGDITTLGAEKKIVTADNTTYPSPYILSDDPTHIYLCWRGINWHPTIAQLTIPDSNDNLSISWGPYQIVQSTGARPYCKYNSNGKDKIFMTYTTGHPDNEYPNYLYFDYIDVNTKQLKDIKGTVLSTIANGVHNVNKTTYPGTYPYAVVDAPTDQRDWVWQTCTDTDGNPVIAMVQISNDKNTHNYYYAKWTGTQWRKTFLANGGGKFHQTDGLELCYSGGMTIDDSNPNIVYCSQPVAGTNGTKYEIVKYTIATDGTIQRSENVTQNSALNNARPYIIRNSGNSPLRLGWMYGNYYDWIVSSTRPLGYPTEIHCDWQLPSDPINLNRELATSEDFNGSITGTATCSNGVLVCTSTTSAVIPASPADSFSISLTPYLYEGQYAGTLFSMGNISYGVNSSTQKPYVKIGSTVYSSTNLLGTSDVWQTADRGTGGQWYTPTKLKFFNLTLTYEHGLLRIYRNGLIDQSIDIAGLTLADLNIGGFVGWVADCKVYKRALNQGEVKKLSETSLSYTLPSGLTTNAELESITIPAKIYTDIVLPTKSASGNTVSWSSDNEQILPASGLISFPAMASSVVLRATINGLSKDFTTVVYPRDITNNKLIEYRFEASELYAQNSANYLKDKSGKGNDALIAGNALINGTLDLSANTATGFSTNGYALVPSGVLGKLRSCSFLAKINAASLTNQPRIFDFGSASSNSFLLRANAFSTGLKYNGGSTTLVNSSTTISAGQETKVAVTFDAKTKTAKIYLNGTQTASATTFTYEPYQLTAIGTDSRNYIGRTQWWDSSVASSNVDFCGTIDDFMVYDIALTASEINQLQSQSSTALDENKMQNKFFFPNPIATNSDIHIGNGYENGYTFSLTTTQGKTILNQITNSSTISLKGIQSGIYIVSLTKNDKSFCSKLIIE